MNFPAFGEESMVAVQINERTKVYTLERAEASAFDSYCNLLAEDGFCKKEARLGVGRQYAAYEKEGTGVFVTAYEGTGELRIVVEEECKYFFFADQAGKACTTPQITQIALEDFGMSYVIRLSDGRIIVIDGGREFEPDQDKLLARLYKDSNGETPVIAAWIMSHPHSDHFHCFNGFMDQYSDRVRIQSFLLNFPDAEDLEHYPKLVYENKAIGKNSSCDEIPRMYAHMEKTGAPIYIPRTGQIYRIGDAVLEILSCMDDTIHISQNINASALVIRMELGGQTILWSTDASFGWGKIPERYGAYLKSDILQIPHHGFQCGSAEAEIAGYQLIRPKVCLLPVIDYNAYTVFCTYKKGSRYLMTDPEVEEIITGDVERTIPLPYTPNAHDQADWRARFRFGLDSSGANAWIYSGLSTANEEDFVYTILNTTNLPAHISIDFYFEDPKATVRFVQAVVTQHSIKILNIVGDEVDKDFGYYNLTSLAKQGLPENAPFAVRFTSDIPVVVSHARHTASYHTTNNV